MTSQKDQIQTLIAEIDKVLQKPSTRLPWVMSGEAAQQRRVLERVRSYLVSLQQRMAADEQFSQARTKSNLSTYDIQYQPTQGTDYARAPIAPIASSQDEAARQILQAVVQEMDHLRSSLTQPLQADLEALRQQRESLVQEIRQLEAQRQHYSLAQQQANQQKIISEFLQVLMGRLQDSLAQQVAQALAMLQPQTPYELNATEPTALSGRMTADQPLLNPGQRLEQLQVLQARSDQLLMNLDSTLSVVFEALQRNVQSYQESLSTGLERMHGLGQQGEVMFTALVSHLAQQLGREASSFLYSSLPPSELESDTATNAEAAPQQTSIPPAPEVNTAPPAPEVSTAPPSPVSAPQAPVPQPSYDSAAFDLPYAGAELRQASDRSPLLPELDDVPELDDADILEDLNLEGLDLSGVELEDVELDSDNLDALLDVVLSSNSSSSSANPSSLAQSEVPDTSAQLGWQDSPATPSADLATSASELEFLEQLDIALQHPDAEPESANADLVVSSELYGLGWVAETSSQKPDSAESTEPMPETNDLYADLFGSDNFGVEMETQPELEDFAASPSTPPAIVDLPLVNPPHVADAWVEPVEIAEAEPAQSSDLSSIQASDLFAELEAAAPVANIEPLSGVEELGIEEPGMEETISSDLTLPKNELDRNTLDELDQTGTTLEDFLFADAVEPSSDENSELLNFNPPLTEAVAQPLEDAEPATATDPAEDPAEIDLDDFRSSFIDESDELGNTTSLAELAELLGGAEVVTETPSAGTPTTASLNLSSQPNLEDVESESELLLSEFSLQDVPVLSANDANQTLEDAYVPAAPEEFLIAIDDDLGDETEVSLWLDENIVQQLSEDLFSLESSDGLFFESANANENRADEPGGFEDRGFESRETALNTPSNIENADLDLGSADPLALDMQAPPASLNEAQSSDSQAWDNLTLEDFAETLPETLPTVDAEPPEALPDDLAAFWEGAAPSTSTEPPDLTLDAFDLLADLPEIAPPPPAEQVTPTAPTTQLPVNPPTELDTQSLTIDDAFIGFSEATNQPAVDNSDRNVEPSDPPNLQPDEKKKI